MFFTQKVIHAKGDLSKMSASLVDDFLNTLATLLFGFSGLTAGIGLLVYYHLSGTNFGSEP